ncbi:aldo/keto reductase [Microbacterium immunditiarum]|uniref:Aryl-alcohol dehydrogenase-like predicted oxidoreductase n=1 Tax=Microbacterium immunditiarum TaxID=337480 RepID=A0A7Y9KH09_9MICO|nr:aldo/keto reductase [Microbacterium immunditiarum]NYE19012.1 aryl-alcohol dehydrogenase-like predicted oxidoreductase [Microbacterium immunditiarum]
MTDAPPGLALGTMLFGTKTPEPVAFALLDRFVERGGMWIDTADCYAFWLSESGRGDDSERVIGRWLAARPGLRDSVRISTKVGAEPADDRSWRGWPGNREGLSKVAVLRAVEASLARLGVDRVDLLWLHQEDRSVPIEETADAADELVREGAVDRIGASNHPAWRVERARAHALARGARPIDAVQLAATYLRPRPGATIPGNDHLFGQLSDEQLDHARETGMEVWAYTPLLRGAYDDPARAIPDAFRHEGSDRRLAALNRVAARHRATAGQIVLAWLMHREPGMRPIVGASSLAQLDHALDSADILLSADDLAELDGVDG